MLSLPRSHCRLERAHHGLEPSARLALHCAQCDRCGGLILGTRFHCASSECADFDLCATCHRRSNAALAIKSHRREHAVIALRRPLSLECEAFSALVQWIDHWRARAGALLAERALAAKVEDWAVLAVCSGCGSEVDAARASCVSCTGHAVLVLSASPERRLALLAAAVEAVQFASAPALWRCEAVVVAEEGEAVAVAEDKHARAAERSASPRAAALAPLSLATHLRGVLAVENICFAEPYAAKVFGRLLGLSTSIRGVVAEGRSAVDDAPRVDGYVLFDARDAEGGAEGDDEGEVAAEYGGAASIVSICVRPDCRGRGVAGALLGAALDAARHAGARAVRLHVHDDNHGAQRLYARFGFEVEGRELAYYRSPPGDALRMLLAF